MRTFPTKFDLLNKSGYNRPALIVKLQSNVFYADQKYQSDWAACWSSSNVDWTPSPPNDGEVQLKRDVVAESINQPNATIWRNVNQWNYAWQSFSISNDRSLDYVNVVIDCDASGIPIQMDIYTADKTSVLYSKTKSTEASGEHTEIFSFSDIDVNMPPGEYWYKFSNLHPSLGMTAKCTMPQSTSYYTGGEAWYFNTETGWGFVGDWQFSIGFLQYQNNGHLITQTVSLSAIPEQYGEWVFDDVVPTSTSLLYQAWSVNTPNWTFPNSWESLGMVTDGQQITNLKQFYRIQPLFTSNIPKDRTPILKSIRADFSLYEKFSNRTSFGIPVSVIDVSNLSMEIDLFKGSTIGQIDIRLAATPHVKKWLALSRPKNKMVKVLAGFVSRGFTEADFIDYRWGQIDDYSLEDDVVSITMKDFSKEWDADVPAKWVSVADDIIWTGSHHCDVIKDILLNRIAVRDSKLDTGALQTVKEQTSGWQVSRKVTGNSENAADLVEQLRMNLAAFFIHTPTGAIKIKRWDASELPSISLDDKIFIKKSWESNAEELYNRCVTYFAWVGSGGDAKDFAQFKESVNSDSQYQYQQVGTQEFKDLWTTAAGSAQIADLHSKIIARYGDPAPSIFHAVVDRKYLDIEVGDMVSITTACVPSSDGVGIVDMKFQVVHTEFDFMHDRINLDFKRA